MRFNVVEFNSGFVQNVTPIIRSTGERTTECCKSLLAEIFPENTIILINEVPFEKAIYEGYKRGIECGREWTLIIDADVLPYKPGVENFLKCAFNVDNTVFVTMGQIIDFAWCGIRSGGIRLYRTSMLSEAIVLIPEFGTKGRPESAVLHAMKARGKPFYMADIIIGIHDYEQSYKDIFRKGIQHENKHRPFKGCMESLWKRESVNNHDYTVALMGMKIGEIITINNYVDVQKYPENISQLLKLAGLEEKSPLHSNEISNNDLEKIIVSWKPSSEYQLMMERIDNKLSLKKIYHPAVIIWYLKFFMKIKFNK